MSERGGGLLDALAATALAGLMTAGAMAEARHAARTLAGAIDRSAMITLARNHLEQAVAQPCTDTRGCPADRRCALERVHLVSGALAAGRRLERLEVRIEDRAASGTRGVSLATVIERAAGCGGTT